MKMIRIGILSDTHLSGPTARFRQQVQACFNGVEMILHAGDLTDPSVLEAFAGRQVHAVHGNMCGHAAQELLPGKKIIQVNGFTIGLIHGNFCYRHSHDMEDCLLNELAPADCIVYGHTHEPVCHRVGPVLFINPGRFSLEPGRGTYAILEVGEQLFAAIHTLAPLP